MANIGELSVGVKVDEWSLSKATKKVQTDFKKTGDSVEKNFTQKTEKWASRIRGAFWGLWGLIAGVFSIWAIVSFTKNLFQLWSDLEEVSSKFDVVFKWSQAVKDEFEAMAKATNRSNLELITFWSGIWNVLAPLWLAQDVVDGLSVSLTKLAIDVASFNNVSDAQAVNAFTSALTGEREALKSLWIVISDADVKNKAYNLWLAEQGDQLTKQQTALATYQLLLENTANAHGDAIRTWDSFANQLKWLRGAIKDVFANAWKDVAWKTAWLLKNITVFVSSYGWAIISTIVETGKMIWSVIWDLLRTFGSLFSFITWGTNENKDDMQSFALVFMKVVQGFWVWVKLIATIIKTLVDIIAIEMWAIINYFVAWFKSITDGWNIVKTAFIWTLKSIVDVISLGAETIGQIFVGMADAVVWVFKGIAENVWVAMKKAWNLAIKGINAVIDAVNKIPGVDINRLTWFDDAEFKPFELKFWKNIKAMQANFEKFWKNIKSNYAWIWDSFWNIQSNFAEATDNVVWVAEWAFANMGKNWGDLATDIEDWNASITQSLEDWAKKSQENAKKYDEWYYSILDLIDQYKGGVDDANKKTEWQWKVAEETVDKIKDLYKEWEKKVDDLWKAQEKLADDTKKYNQDIEDSLRSLNTELAKTTAEYNKAVSEIQWQASTDIAQRWVEVANDLADVEKQITELKAKQIDDAEDEKKRKEDLLELEREKTDLLKEQQFIIWNTTEEQRKEAERVAGLSDAEKIKEDADKEIAIKNKAFEEEKARIESLQRINKVFLWLKKFDEDEYNKLIANERFLAMTQEEQELILKLAREKMQLTMQKDAIIQMQQEVYDATVELSNSATAIQQSNINSLKWEYATLIAQIQTAIAKQRELNALKSSWWFASGWFTWQGWANEVAWVVHKGEWVAPKWMVNSMRPLFDSLEASRTKWFASGWYTNTTNKTQNNNITVNSWVDLRWFIDYAKWKL